MYENQGQNTKDIEDIVPVRAGVPRTAVFAMGDAVQVRAGQMDSADAETQH